MKNPDALGRSRVNLFSLSLSIRGQVTGWRRWLPGDVVSCMGGFLLLGMCAVAAAEDKTAFQTVANQDQQTQAVQDGWNTLRQSTRTFGPNHPQTVAALIALADAHSAAGSHAQAEPLLDRALLILEEDPQHNLPQILLLQEKHLLNHYHRGHYSQVLTQGEKFVALATSALGPVHPLLDRVHFLLAHAHMGRAQQLGAQRQQLPAADTHLEQALALFNRESQPFMAGRVKVYRIQAGLRLWNNQLAEAETLLQSALTLLEKESPVRPQALVEVLHDMGRLLGGAGQFARAIPFLQRARTVLTEAGSPPQPPWGDITLHLALCQMEERQFSVAEPLLQEAIAWSGQQEKINPLSVPDMLNYLGLLYQMQDKAALAKTQFDRAMTMAEHHFRGNPSELSLWRVQRDYLVPGTSRNASRQLMQKGLVSALRHPDARPDSLELSQVGAVVLPLQIHTPSSSIQMAEVRKDLPATITPVTESEKVAPTLIPTAGLPIPPITAAKKTLSLVAETAEKTLSLVAVTAEKTSLSAAVPEKTEPTQAEPMPVPSVSQETVREKLSSVTAVVEKTPPAEIQETVKTASAETRTVEKTPPDAEAKVAEKTPPATDTQVAEKTPPATDTKVTEKSPPAADAKVAEKTPPATDTQVAEKTPPAAEARVAEKTPPAVEIKVAEKTPAAETKVAEKAPPATDTKVAEITSPTAETKVAEITPPATDTKVAEITPPATDTKVAEKTPPATDTKVAEKTPAADAKVAEKTPPAAETKISEKSPPTVSTVTEETVSIKASPPHSEKQAHTRKSFFVTAGCFIENEYIEDIEKRLASLHVATFRKKVTVEKGTLTCVYGGPFAAETQAEAALRLTRDRAGVKDAVIRTMR
ncbi:MAG: tetratricopeptide repeat protein [Magnetococcus sp. DMHC-1]